MRTLVSIVISALLQTATPYIEQDADAGRDASMSYTIEVRTLPTLGSEVVGRFTDSAWNLLWQELQISEQQWEDWHSSQINVPLLPEFPEISKLAYIDEGVVHFQPKELSNECIRLMPTLSGEETRKLIERLQKASELAMGSENSEVIVHPFPA
jgi:hypothetical protein